MTHDTYRGAIRSASNLSLAETKKRIEMQEKRVFSMEPGSEGHRSAVGVLLLLQDSLCVLVEAHEMIQRARMAAAKKDQAR